MIFVQAQICKFKQQVSTTRGDKRGVTLISDALPFGRLLRRARFNHERNRVRQGSDLGSDSRCDAHRKIAVPTSIGASARCFPNDQGLLALLHIAGIALESQMAKNPAPAPPTISTHVYEIRPRADKHGIDLFSDVLPYSPLWYAGPTAISNAISFAKFNSGSHDAVIRVYDDTGNVIETEEEAGDFKEF